MNIGNGLVEIGALTTLIGSTTAGDLAVGNKGSAGIVWGSITVFGNSSVIKACAGAALPGWLRYILGLRTRASDEAVGMDLSLGMRGGGMMGRFVQAVRTGSVGAGEPQALGVLSESDGLFWDDENNSRSARPNPPTVKYKDVLAFDRTTSIMLEGLASTPAGHPLEIYTFHPYDCYPHHNAAFQLTALGLSLLKLAEVYYLFSYGGKVLGSLSALPFAFSLVVAIVVEIQDLFASRRPMSVDGHVDILVGAPPTMKQPGGPRKVILGGLKNPKRGIWWKAYYTINAILQIISLLIYYELLGQDKAQFVTGWSLFQVLWVTLRAFLFHFTDLTAPMMHRKMSRHEFWELPSEMRLRVLNLIGAVGIYGMHLHPRDGKNYKDDTFSASQISTFLKQVNIQEVYELPLGHSMPGASLHVEIVGVIGDTLLSGATWLAGKGYSPMDVYDSCIIVLSVPTTPPSRIPRTIAIPSARVFSVTPDTSKTSITDTELESRQPTFVPRGAGHGLIAGHRLDWIYWIPCGPRRDAWLHFRSEKQTVLGRVEVRVLSDEDVGRMLAAGTMNIGFKEVGDVKAVVNTSREVIQCLATFIDV